MPPTGFCFFTINITLPATQYATLEAFIQVRQDIDLKIIGINSVQTGNWSILWGSNTIDFSQGNSANPQGFVGYANVFGIGVLPRRWMDVDQIGDLDFDYCPIFPRSSVIDFLFRNDTASV